MCLPIRTEFKRLAALKPVSVPECYSTTTTLICPIEQVNTQTRSRFRDVGWSLHTTCRVSGVITPHTSDLVDKLEAAGARSRPRSSQTTHQKSKNLHSPKGFSTVSLGYDPFACMSQERVIHTCSPAWGSRELCVPTQKPWSGWQRACLVNPFAIMGWPMAPLSMVLQPLSFRPRIMASISPTARFSRE